MRGDRMRLFVSFAFHFRVTHHYTDFAITKVTAERFQHWRFYDLSQITLCSLNNCRDQRSPDGGTWNADPGTGVAFRNQRQGFLADDRGPLRAGRRLFQRKLRLERASVSGRCSGTQGDYEARRGLYRRWSRTEFYVRVGIAVEAGVRHRHPAAEHAGTAHVRENRLLTKSAQLGDI